MSDLAKSITTALKNAQGRGRALLELLEKHDGKLDVTKKARLLIDVAAIDGKLSRHLLDLGEDVNEAGSEDR